jgi:nucleoside-diphosphate-sugar epimerase
MESAHSKKRVLIAGASGLIGQAALTHFETAADWEVIAVSRRLPRIANPGRVQHVTLDLTDRAACAAAVASLPAVSHLVYCAVYETPNLMPGWRDKNQMETNLDMLRNLVDPLIQAGRLRHVSLLQGTKAYGVHLHALRVPARESQPRDPHENFYWLQEDYLRAQCDDHGLAMTILRPQIVFGDVAGVAMNLIPVIGAYAAIRKAEGRPFSFPGGPAYTLEAVDARLIAQALSWAAESPEAANETFNITNGDVFVWQNVWPTLAKALGVELGDPEPLSLARELPEKAAVWRQVAERHALR